MSGSQKWASRVCVVGATVLLGAGASPAFAAGARARVGGVTPRPAHATATGRLPATHRLRLTVEIAPRNPLALAAFAHAVTTPASPRYGDFISVRQFARRFGAPDSRISGIAGALRADGLHVGTPSANGLQVSVSGTVGRIDRAFAVTEQSVRLADGRRAYANAQAPTLPVAIARGVQAVLGLDDLHLEQSGGLVHGRRSGLGAQSHVTPDVADNGGPQPCAAATSVTGSVFPGGVTADSIATAYGLNSLYAQNDFGQGQTVALVEFEGFDPGDIAAYQSCYGTDAQVSTVNVDGGPDDFSDDTEAALDIEQVVGLAPQARVDVYQAPSDDSTAAVLSAIVSADSAKVISESWGLCEADTDPGQIAATNTLLQEAAAQGQSFFASSGDSGSAGCDEPSQGVFDSSLALIDPGSEPWATSVGGTLLYGGVDSFDDVLPYAPGGPAAQAVWNDGEGSASGGGISSLWAMPSYQSSASPSLGVVSSLSSGGPCGSGTDCREVPDVSADADPNSGYSVEADGGWETIGGTSASAPLWATFTALANASAACDGLTLGFLNPQLYALAGSAYGPDFTDITGTNPLTGADSNDGYAVDGDDPNGDLYPVTAGYDMATGLGSMVAGPLAQSLCTARHTFSVSVASPGGPSGTVDTPFAVGVSATDSGGAALSFSASGLPAGLAINPATGAISGTPTAPGVATVTVTAADAYGNAGVTQFPITIHARTVRAHRVIRPYAQRVTLSGLGHRRPDLAFVVHGGSGRLSLLRVSLPAGLKLSHRARALDHGLTIKAGRRTVAFTAKVVGGVLEVRLAHAESAVIVGVARPALTVTRTEARQVRRGSVRQLKLVIAAQDTNHLTGRRSVVVRRLS